MKTPTGKNRFRWQIYSIFLLPFFFAIFLINEFFLPLPFLGGPVFRQVPIAKPRVGPVIEAVYGLGTVVAEKDFQAKVGVNKVVEEIYVREGDRVSAKTPLVKFDESLLVRAPFDGTVTSVNFKPGEMVFPQVPVLTLTNLEKFYLEVSLEQQAALRVKKRQEAVITFESIRNEKYSGIVETIYPKENQFLVRIGMDHFPEGVLPGMTADVAILVGKRENVLSVPLKALAGGKVVILENNRKKKVEVKIGVVDGEWAEVLSGNIKAEDQIVVREK